MNTYLKMALTIALTAYMAMLVLLTIILLDELYHGTYELNLTTLSLTLGGCLWLGNKIRRELNKPVYAYSYSQTVNLILF